MNNYELKIKKFMFDEGIAAQHLVFTESCHSVEEAARAVNASPEDLVKNICLLDDKGRLIVAIVKGEDRVSKDKVKSVADAQRIKSISAEEIEKRVGYPCGGVPSFGYEALFIIDEKVMEKEIIYSGGGSQNSLIKLSPLEMLKANNAIIAEIRVSD